MTTGTPTLAAVGENEPITGVAPPTWSVAVSVLPLCAFTECRPAMEAVQTFAVHEPSGVIVKVVPLVRSPRELP
jgi:hypothetical protein